MNKNFEHERTIPIILSNSKIELSHVCVFLFVRIKKNKEIIWIKNNMLRHHSRACFGMLTVGHEIQRQSSDSDNRVSCRNGTAIGKATISQ